MKEELTEFDIFQALDRTSVLINMVSETLGSVFIPEKDGGLDDVLPAVKKHYKLLENVQENLRSHSFSCFLSLWRRQGK